MKTSLVTKWPVVALLLLGSHGAFGAAQTPPAAPPKPAPIALPTVPPPAEQGFTELQDLRVLDRLCHETQLVSDMPDGTKDIVQERLDQAGRRQARKDALKRVYVARLPSSQFNFSDYDAEEGRLGIETAKGFYSMRGSLALWSVQGEPLELTLSSGQVQEIAKAKKLGTLGLVLYMHLDAEPEDTQEEDTLKGEPCASRPASNSYKLAVLWLGGELVDVTSGRRYARFATEHGRSTPNVAQLLLGDTTMEIKQPDGAGAAAGDVLKAFEARRANLNGCYVKHGDHAEGGMVLGLDVDGAGNVKHVGIDVASLDNEELAQCLAAEVRGANLGARTLANVHVAVPLFWGRAD